MAKYTTQVRSICESLSGLSESKGLSDVSTILTNAAPKVFDFDFPIFDETYRLPLEVKILKHFYMREIGEETVGLWKLRLDMRLNEIMPFYNKLYNSELLTFNPFYEVDYTKTGNRTGNETGTEETGTESTSTNTMTGTVADQGSKNETDKLTGTVSDQGTSSLTDKMSGTVTDEGTNALTETMTGTITDQGTSSLTDRMTGTVTDTGEGTTTRTDDLTSSTENGGSDHEESASANKNDHWDYYSDTPQGSVGNLESLTYLTNARHITDDGSGSEISKDTEYGKTTETTNTGTQTTTDETEVTRTHNTTDTKSGTESNTKTHDTTNEKTGESESTKTYDTTDTKNGTESNTRTHNTTDTLTGTTANTRTYDTENETVNNGTTTTEKTIDNVVEYAEHVIGKMSTTSYAKMLKEFRETFLNIDMMIINDLNDLFFGLWE